MKYCNQCGNPVLIRIPDGDNRPRFVCGSCHTVHCENPRIVAGCANLGRPCCSADGPSSHVVVTGPCRQASWRTAKTLQQAAERETLEEACARVTDLQLYTLFDLPHINQVYMFFRAQLVDLEFCAGDESLEVKLFEQQDIPWSELAFPTIGRTLECFFADRVQQTFPVRTEAVTSYRNRQPQNARAD